MAQVDDIDVLAEKLEAFLKNQPNSASSESLARLSEAARKVSLATESTGDTIHRVISLSFQLPLAQIGIEKHIFEVLSETNSAISCAELAKKTGIDPPLLKRLLRFYQSVGMVSQVANDGFEASNVTKALATSTAKAATTISAELITKTVNALPEFLRKTGYANPTDHNYCPWHLGLNTDMSPFVWFKDHPETMNVFLTWMAHNRDGRPSFFEVFDIRDVLANQKTDDSTVVFVDVGGAKGHQCIALKTKSPDLPGRVVLQDQPEVIEQANTNPLPGFQGIETQAYDFWKPQHLKGARSYYMRNILHDWPDAKCIEIIQNLKAGFADDSVLLIDDIVLPEKGSSWTATQMDLSIMTTLAATERSEDEWHSLLDRAGFKIVKILNYDPHHHDSVIVGIPK